MQNRKAAGEGRKSWDSYLRTVPRVGIAALNPDASPVGVLAHSREVGFRSRRIHPAQGWA